MFRRTRIRQAKMKRGLGELLRYAWENNHELAYGVSHAGENEQDTTEGFGINPLALNPGPWGQGFKMEFKSRK